MTKLDAREKGYDAGVACAKRVGYNAVTSVMATAAIAELARAESDFALSLQRRYPSWRASVLADAFRLGGMQGITEAIRERRTRAARYAN